MKSSKLYNSVKQLYIEQFPALLEDMLQDDIFFDSTNRLVENCKKNNGCVFLFGNGGSMATCSHFASDLEKNANVKAEACSDISKMTTLANDFGYSNMFVEYFKRRVGANDLVVLISVSGESENLIRVVECALEKNVPIITMTGRKQDNSLMRLNDCGHNLHINSDAYNIVENLHSTAMGLITDTVIGKLVYEPN